MNIGVDAKWYFDGPPGGKTYLSNLLNALLELNRENKFFVFLDGADDIRRFPFKNRNNIHVECVGSICSLSRILLRFPKLIRKYNLDIVFTQSFIPLFCKAKRLVTIHDIIFETNPEFFTRKELCYYKFMKYSASKADIVFTVSEFMKNVLVDKYCLDPKKVVVTHNGVDMDRFNNKIDKAEIDRVKHKYHLPEVFLLYVGRINVRKNLSNLITAFSNLTNKDAMLVLAGKHDGKTEKISALIHKLNLKERVLFTGFVDDVDLPAIYNAATVFCYVPVIEGFRIPPLEAMACGVPVIASATSSLPEVVGDAGILVSPFDVNEISRAMGEVFNNSRLRRRLSENGLKQARKFSWKRSAEIVLNVVNNL